MPFPTLEHIDSVHIISRLRLGPPSGLPPKKNLIEVLYALFISFIRANFSHKSHAFHIYHPNNTW